MKKTSIATLFVLMLLLVACQLVEKEAEKRVGKGNVEMAKKVGSGLQDVYNSFQDVSIEDERALGETVALQAYATPGCGTPIENPNLMSFINLMTNAIAQNSDRPMIPYHTCVIKSDDFNAFSAPGGYIFLTSALVMAMDSEDELACVIGHEIAHVARKHALCSMKRAKRLEGFAKISSAAFNSNFGEFEKLVKNMTQEVFVHNFDLEMETDSDLRGIRYAMATGYDPKSFLDFLNKLKKMENSKSTLASHPHADARIEKVNEELKKIAEELKNKKTQESLDDFVKKPNRIHKMKEWIQSSKPFESKK